MSESKNSVIKSESIFLTLNKNLLSEIEKIADKNFTQRNEIIRRACVHYIEYVETIENKKP